MEIFIIVGVVLALIFWYSIKQDIDRENGSEWNGRAGWSDYTDEKLRHIGDSAFETRDPGKLREKLDHMDYLYESAKGNRESERTLENVRFHREDVREAYEDALETKWEEKMQPIAEELDCNISMVLEDPQHGIEDIDDVIRARNKAMRLYDKYWEMGRAFNDKYGSNVYIKGYLLENSNWKELVGSENALREALDKAVEQLKPEQRRKRALYRNVMEYVAKGESVQRAALLKNPFPEATAEEVRFCYLGLLREYKLVEIKIGNRWFVTLSDKEKEKREKAAEKKRIAQEKKTEKESPVSEDDLTAQGT